jgi:hypothetical protein
MNGKQVFTLMSGNLIPVDYILFTRKIQRMDGANSLAVEAYIK